MSRDYLGLKVWDLRMETKPVETYPVSIFLRNRYTKQLEYYQWSDKMTEE